MEERLNVIIANSNERPEVGDRAQFYQTHLDRVSRSFAFCIARLDGALREQVGLSYLLCRLLDTIEDADWSDFSAQNAAFDSFDRFILEKDLSSERRQAVRAWADGFPKDLVPGERLLLADAEEILADFHRLSPELGAGLGRLVLSMSGGMRFFMEKKARVGALRLESSSEVNRYCFFVAGVVGEMLTQILAKGVSSSLSRLKDAFRFGLFLQKINLLKDQAGDEELGRFLVPSRPVVLASLLRDGDAAFRFLRGLPEKEVGFRLFCAWSLYLGLASLPWIQRADAEGQKLRIPREETMRLLVEVESRIHDNQALARLYDEMSLALVMNAAEDAVAAESGPDEERLLALYRGDLPASEVLGLFRA